VRLKWKKRVLEHTGQEEHRLRRGDLTLVTVGPVDVEWYFHGRIPGGGAVNTLGRSMNGEDGPRTWANLEEAREAAAAWVRGAKLLAAEPRAET
jgi:hypothetical protein